MIIFRILTKRTGENTLLRGKDGIVKVKDKCNKTYNGEEWKHVVAKTFYSDQDCG